MTFAAHIDQASSEKIGLVIMRASYRVTGWSVFSETIYSADFSDQVIELLTEDGTELSVGLDSEALNAGEYYLDRNQGKLFVRTSGSVDPDSVFIAVRVQLFFSNVGLSAPHDLGSGFEVDFLPLFIPDSVLSVGATNTKSLLGISITSGSSLNFVNELGYWDSIFDQYSFETNNVTVYSGARGVDSTEFEILYKGKIQGKKWSEQLITFEVTDVLDELRSPVSLTDLSDRPNALISNSLSRAKERRIYGKVLGHVLTPIDQITKEGYAIEGTVVIDNGSQNVVGIGTSFLSRVAPGDECFIGSDASKLTVESVTSDTELTLSEPYLGNTQVNAAFKVLSLRGKRYANRSFLVAGHSLSRPQATISQVIDAAAFFFSGSFPVEEGDVIEVNGSQAEIRVLGDGFIKLVESLSATPAVGDALFLGSVGNVHIEDRKLSLTTDYTYDASTALVTLTDTAEFNVAPKLSVSGNVTITNGSRSVSGSGTQFTNEFESGDWIKGSSRSTWFEILEVVDDTNLTLVSAPGASDTVAAGSCDRKKPALVNDETIVSADCFGKPDNDGNLLEYAGSICKDLLEDAGLSSQIEETSFDDIDQLVPMRLSIAIPETFNSRTVPSIRDTMNKVCRSTFTLVTLNNDFRLRMRQVAPEVPSGIVQFTEGDLLSLSVNIDGNDIVSSVRVGYAQKEYDPNAGEASSFAEQVNLADFLVDTAKEFEIDTALANSEDANVISSRWAFLLERSYGDIRIKVKLSGIRLEVGDVVGIEYSKLFQRFGSTDNRRIAVVSQIRKTPLDVELILNDLGNSFSRACRIAEDDSPGYLSSSDDQKVRNGFFTDANGLTSGVSGINLVW